MFAHGWHASALASCLQCLIGLTGATDANISAPVPTYTWRYNHSTVIESNVNIHTNGSGSAYAFACQAASQSWEQSLSHFNALQSLSNNTRVVPAFTTVSEVTKEFWEVWTTDCDGITHVRGTTPTSSTVSPTTSVWFNYTLPFTTTFSAPEPSCIIQPSDCKAVLESYSTESSALESWRSQFAVPFYITSRPPMPSCSSICTESQTCMIMGDHVRLIYWPVTTTGANSCGTNGTTVTNPSNTTRTIEALGTTFTSPTEYISFNSLSAWDWGCRTQIGEGISGTIIPILPENLSSARGYHLGRSPYPFNLADLNGFVTSAAFFQMQGYDWSGPGETIYDDLYFPTIWLPNIVTRLRPEWTTCQLSPFGVNDPPIELTSVQLLVTGKDKGPIKTPGYDLHPGGYGSAPTPTKTPAPSALPPGKDPLATGHGSSQRSQASQPNHAPGSSSSKGIGDYILSGVGIPHSRSTSVKPSRTKIVFGTKGASVVGQSGTKDVSQIYPLLTQHVATTTYTIRAQTGANAPGGAAVSVFEAPYASPYFVEPEVDFGETVVVGDGITLTVDGPATTMSGFTFSAASDGLFFDDIMIPYATATSDGGSTATAEFQTVESTSEATTSASATDQSASTETSAAAGAATTTQSTESGALVLVFDWVSFLLATGMASMLLYI